MDLCLSSPQGTLRLVKLAPRVVGLHSTSVPLSETSGRALAGPLGPNDHVTAKECVAGFSMTA